MADQETCAAVSEEAASDSQQRCRHGEDKAADSTSGMISVTCSSAEPVPCSSEVIGTPADCLETSVSTLSIAESCNSDIDLPVDTANNVLSQPVSCQNTDGSVDVPSSPRLTLCLSSTSSQESLIESAQQMVSAKSQLSCSTDFDTDASDVCHSFSNQNFHSRIYDETVNSATNKTPDNLEETQEKSEEAEDFSSPVPTTTEHMLLDQVKPSPAIVSTPEALSVRRSTVQSSLHGTRQVKCRKTGHRRITANGANLSLGQLINAVSESCLSDSLDSTYMPTSSLSTATEHRMTTPVKAANAADSSDIKEKLFGHFDGESASATSSPLTCSTNEACGSPLSTDGIRRQPRARKSCHSNDSKAVSDLPKEKPSTPGTPFGSVRLAELVDAQSLDKLDVRTFDEMLLAKMWDRMRPSNGFKLLLQNNEQSQMQSAVSPPVSEGAAAGNSVNKMQDLGSGMPLIPSVSKPGNVNSDSLAQTSAVNQKEKQVICSSATQVLGPSSRKRVWRCRKSNPSLGNAHHRVNKVDRQPHESNVTVDAQATRRSPRSAKHSQSWGHLNKVGKRLVLILFNV